MAAKCDDIGKEINKGSSVNKEIGKKCKGVNKRKARKYEYVVKKFGFCRVFWIIKNPCITPPIIGEIFCIPEFYVRGFHLTKWSMSLERKKNEKRDRNDKNIYKVIFRLKRLQCEPFYEDVVADCFLEFSGHGGNVDMTFNHTFGNTMHSVFEAIAVDAGITPTEDYHLPNFKLKLEILVYFEGLKETFSLCEDLGVRRLSENLSDLYDSGADSDLILKCGSRQLQAHKCVVYSRIKNEDFRSRITSGTVGIDLDEFVYTNVEKVIRFLYTGSLNYTVTSDPSIAVFKFAEWLDVKPIIAYYNPEEITFTSDIDIEEFSAIWTIEDFCSRDEDFLQSPIMTNKMMDTKWQITVYPKGFRNEGVYLDIFLVYEILTVSKDICAELSLVCGPDRLFSQRFHRKINSEGKLKTHKFIKLDEVLNNYIGDDSLSIGLRLRMCSGKNNLTVCDESKADYKYLSEQKYYDHLSDDILSIHMYPKFYNLDIHLDHHNFKLKVHQCILLARCPCFFDSLKKNLHSVSLVIILEILHFVYSGKLHEVSPVAVTFALYEGANHFGYQHLKNIVIEKLLDALSSLNRSKILEFAVAQGIRNLEDAARNYQ